MTTEYQIERVAGGFVITDHLHLRELEVSNRYFASAADAQQVIDEHAAGVHKGHHIAFPPFSLLLDGEVVYPAERSPQ
jgi:hypothetical protein